MLAIWTKQLHYRLLTIDMALGNTVKNLPSFFSPNNFLCLYFCHAYFILLHRSEKRVTERFKKVNC